jgi:hypothetical protein
MVSSSKGEHDTLSFLMLLELKKLNLSSLDYFPNEKTILLT